MLLRTGAPGVLAVAAGLDGPWLFVHLARRARVLSPDERERLRATLGRRGPALAGWVP